MKNIEVNTEGLNDDDESTYIVSSLWIQKEIHTRL